MVVVVAVLISRSIDFKFYAWLCFDYAVEGFRAYLVIILSLQNVLRPAINDAYLVFAFDSS